ncbi:hypothetical protein EBR25_11165, partial [bacterium]|nr:hypothetical protein [bacterium]
MAVKEGLNDPEHTPEEPSSSWARCIKRVYEINPLECPRPPVIKYHHLFLIKPGTLGIRSLFSTVSVRPYSQNEKSEQEDASSIV